MDKKDRLRKQAAGAPRGGGSDGHEAELRTEGDIDRSVRVRINLPVERIQAVVPTVDADPISALRRPVRRPRRPDERIEDGAGQDVGRRAIEGHPLEVALA